MNTTGNGKVATRLDEDRTLTAFVVTFGRHRLPHALDIKEEMDDGALLSDWDIAFLQQAIGEASRARALADRHPELQAFYARAVHLYDQIAVQALKNELQSDQGTRNG